MYTIFVAEFKTVVPESVAPIDIDFRPGTAELDMLEMAESTYNLFETSVSATGV
jgi:hypothetical protein